MAKRSKRSSRSAQRNLEARQAAREEKRLKRYEAGLRTGRSVVPIPNYNDSYRAQESVVAVARRFAKVKLEPTAKEEIQRSRAIVDGRLNDGQAHYGINTGFGSLAKQRIGPDDLRTLQRNLILSHNAGVGEPLGVETVRGMMLLLAASLARGLSGVRPVVVSTLIEMLNRGVVPVVPSVGSVGASGDLAPLAALASVVIGEGQARLVKDRVQIARGKLGPVMSGAAALQAVGLKPVVLEAKEGLALINGTHLMATEGALLTDNANNLLDASCVSLAMSIDACRASHSFLDWRLYSARNHMRLFITIKRLHHLLDGSTIRTSHLQNDPRVQDPYSLRAGPTVLGSVDIAITQIRGSVDAELGAVTDNPLVFRKTTNEYDPHLVQSDSDAILSGANFHGMPIALPLDYLAIALCHLAGISERRTFLITAAAEPEMHQKPYLVPPSRKPGLQSGLMIAQYTAAACVNEMIGLANPASVANIPTCAGMEDYNSYGPRSAAKARRSVELCTKVLAIELLCAAQGLEAHRPLKSGKGVEKAHALIREHVPKLSDDRPLTRDIEAIAALIASGAFSQL